MSYRQDMGVPDIKNGDGKILQKQIDLLHEDVSYIKQHITVVGEANGRSKTNFKLICLLFAGGITLAGATLVSAIF